MGRPEPQFVVGDLVRAPVMMGTRLSHPVIGRISSCRWEYGDGGRPDGWMYEVDLSPGEIGAGMTLAYEWNIEPADAITRLGKVLG